MPAVWAGLSRGLLTSFLAAFATADRESITRTRRRVNTSEAEQGDIMFPSRAIVLVCVVLLITGCARPAHDPTLTFRGNECSYAGPRDLQANFTLNWVVEESGPSTSIYAIVTLDQDKTVDDLARIPAEDPPPSWVHKLAYDLATSPGTYSKSVDLTSKAAYHEGPIYIVCFSANEDVALGAVGPFEVAK